MEAITLSRKELYGKVWSISISKLLDVYEISEDGFYEVCKRLNIPTPDKNHWKKVDQGKKTTTYPFPEESQGSETVTLYLKENEERHKKQLINLLRQVNPELDLENKNSLVLDKLIITSKEELHKNWNDRSGHVNEKNTWI